MFYTPGYDQISTPALFLSGAQVALFTTGRGTGIGCALGPVMKIGSNSPLARMNGDIDIDAGTILEKKETTEAVGRKIEFLVQEMHREVNTIGSKSNDTAIAHSVVELKSELERIREQIQNIE